MYSNLREEYSELLAENYDRDDFHEITQRWRDKNFSNFEHSKRYLLKDNRYMHEKEVRGIIQICRRDRRTVEEYQSHPMAGLDDPAKIIPPDDCEENIYIPIPEDFVRSIKLDSRLPDWKLSAVTAILEKYKIEITVSEAFSPEYDKGKWF